MKGYTYRLIIKDDDKGMINLCDECEKDINEDTYLDPWEPITGCDCDECECCI